MGVFDFVKNGVREMMIARPDQLKSLIVYKHPDQNIPFYSQLTVDSDECAVFFKDGRVVGVLPPGRHTLQSQNIPFLNQIVTKFTGGDVFIAEIFFVKTSPIYGVPFGGPIGDMLDPLTGEQVTPRIFGEFSVVVSDPVRFIVGYAGQATAGNNDQVLNWVKGLFLNGVRIKQIGVAGAQAEAQAKQFELDQKYQQDSRYVANVAGNYQNYAAGQAMIGAGQGMAAHGVGDGGMAGAGMQLAVGMGMAQNMAGAQAKPGPAQPQFQAGAQATCGKCKTIQVAGKFCQECGTPLAASKKFCTGCGGELAGAAKFCANCGTPAP